MKIDREYNDDKLIRTLFDQMINQLYVYSALFV